MLLNLFSLYDLSLKRSIYSEDTAMSCCNRKSRNGRIDVSAVILDLDGTLLDTEWGSRGVLKEFMARYGKILEENNKRLGKTLKESAISIVQDYDLPLSPDQFIDEITPMYREKWLQSKPIPGANRLIKHLHRHGVPFALASNSMRDYIYAKISNQDGWRERFSVILGSDDVESGKPAPDIFIEAAKRMSVDPARCLVIEDSLVGVKAAKAAKMNVVAIPSYQEADCSSMADTVLHSLLQFQPEQWGLPPFEDWVHNALPIDTINLSCVNVKGCLYEGRDDGNGNLPNQASGIFIGLAQIDMHRLFKVVAGIGFNCPDSTRKLQLRFIDDCGGFRADQLLHLSLVGFIRGLNSKEETNMEILEEDESIARVALNLTIFKDLNGIVQECCH